MTDRGPSSLENVAMNATRNVTEGRNAATDDDFFARGYPLQGS